MFGRLKSVMVNEPPEPAVPENVFPLLFTSDANLMRVAWAYRAAKAKATTPMHEIERRWNIKDLP